MDNPLQVGIVGLDTSHCPAFTRILNDAAYEYHLPGARVIGAYPGGSELFSKSRERVQGFTGQLAGEFGVAIYDSIPALAQDVDALFLESVDGRQHLDQFRQMAVGKPVYIDKPLTTTTGEARALIALAQATHTPIMSCSSLRYAAGIADLLEGSEQVLSCEAFGPAPLLDDYPDLFWYGIHSAEILFALMGKGCRQVRCVHTPAIDLVVGEWADGRTGVLRGTRLGKDVFGCVVHTGHSATPALASSTPPYYYLMLQQVLPFFRTGQSPIDIEETFEIIAFLEAAAQSKARAGNAVRLAAGG
ncbi:MAG: Gfo/Idh/MocA family oxidoreductase [Anaerolineae bacterium]|nr:Gfo/Idh/MocA family oxidoreductase [Anaerolineae bacterium]